MSVAVVEGDGADGEGGDLGAAVAGAERAVDVLAAVRFADLTLADQAEAVAGLVRLRSRLEAVEAAAMRAFDAGGEWALDGHRSTAVALAHRCRLSRAEARRRLRLARRLSATPGVTAALAAGQITSEAASLLAAARRPEVAAEFDRDEHLLVDHARTLTHADLTVAVRYWSDRADPTGAEERAVQVEQQARAFVSRTVDDLVRIDAWLDPIGGTAFLTAVQRIEDELFRADWAEATAVHGEAATVEHLARTGSQRRAAALVELAVRASSAPADAKRPLPLVNVVMDAATFEAALRQHAGLPAASPSPRRTAKPSASCWTAPSSRPLRRSSELSPVTSAGSCTTPPTRSASSAPSAASTPAPPATCSTCEIAAAPTPGANKRPGDAKPTTSPPGTAPTPPPATDDSCAATTTASANA